MIQNMIVKKLKKSIYPTKEKISIPLSKKDEKYEEIQKRFKSMRN
jgi:hypothetical protein